MIYGRERADDDRLCSRSRDEGAAETCVLCLV